MISTAKLLGEMGARPRPKTFLPRPRTRVIVPKQALDDLYMAGLNEEPHGLDGSEPGYDKLMQAYEEGCRDRDSDDMGLGESRPTHCFRFLGDLVRKDPTLKLIEIAGQADGMTALIRTADGQAYEVTCKPAAYATHPTIMKHGAGKGTARPGGGMRAAGPKRPNLP